MPYLPSHYCISNSYRNSIVNIYTANNINSIIYVNTAANICIYVAADNVDTLSRILAPEEVLDNKEPDTYGTYLYPKQLGVEQVDSVFFYLANVHLY